MKNSFLTLIIIIINFSNIFSQNNFYILRGEITDNEQNIPVEKAEVLFTNIGKTIKTDKNGRFSIALSSGVQKVQIFHKDYQVSISSVNLLSDTTIKFKVLPIIVSYNLDEVVVTAKVNKVEQTLMSMESIESTQVKKIPTIGGEKDIIKALTFFPGVQTASEGTAEFQVRGGTSDQNLMLFDNAVMYNSTHLYGFLSSFNPSVISNADLYKAAFPAKFGGRLSSILDATTKDVNMKKFQFESEIGLISGKVVMQIPLIKDKAALLISGRRTYFDFFFRAIDSKDVYSFNFYDTFIKYSHKLNDKNKFDIYFYIDRDNTFLRQTYPPDGKRKYNFIYQNKIAGLNYENSFSNKLINNLSINYTVYSTKMENMNYQKKENIDSIIYFQSFTSQIEDFSIKNNLQYKINSKMILNTGFSSVYHNLKPSYNYFFNAEDTLENKNIPNISALDLAVYSDFEYFVNSKFSVVIGIRISDYNVKNKNFINFEPRFSANYRINKSNSIKCSYSRMTQPLHLIANSGLGMPINIWLSSDEFFEPEKSDQIAIAYTNIFDFKSNNYSFTFETYYKTMNNILNYLDGYSSNYFTSSEIYLSNKIEKWQNIITSGKGNSYGAEFLLAKNTGKLTFQAAYTISTTKNQFDKINNGEPFNANNDKRHNFSGYLNYSPNMKFEFGLVLVYITGQPVTLPLNSYFYPGINYDNSISNDYYRIPIPAQSERNKYRMKPYHRIDFSIKWNLGLNKKRKYKSTLSLDIYNIYNRKNPYYYYLDFEAVPDNNSEWGETLGNKAVLKSVSLFPIIPSISYSLKF